MGLNTDTGIVIGKMKKGTKNLITDVPGVKVGHVTLDQGDIQTGVTAILPHEGNLFQDKVMAGCCVINGFGKSAGLVQLEELGTIETPIVLTNTLSVGTAVTALVKYMLEKNEDIGVTTGTVNSLVMECNDGKLNDIRGLHVKEEHVQKALKTASEVFEEGAVGAGRGMCCLGVKGGIGSASRVLEVEEKSYTIGALVLSNFGERGDLILAGNPIGERIRQIQDKDNAEKESLLSKKTLEIEEGDKGSIIMLIATDLPLNERQLKRVAKRAGAGLARTGSFYGNGSGDIAVAFSTSNRVAHYSEDDILSTKMMYDEHLDPVFKAATEATEEAIISSLYHAETVVGVRGTVRKGLKEYLSRL
ncbi:DmpA family aminopeptidase [Anaerovorax sp. IOR16]|uniref:DmpA family aminopeptidase n=1 Tax=Anaerovorax sp. IOR16 TaxID=2773458 RepID=UPI0019D162F4|nr:P1 family peptidase [Anaerovorax sp. IOR16]